MFPSHQYNLVIKPVITHILRRRIIRKTRPDRTYFHCACAQTDSADSVMSFIASRLRRSLFPRITRRNISNCWRRKFSSPAINQTTNECSIAQIWLNEAEIYKYIIQLHHRHHSLQIFPQISAHICFLSQQLAEFSLKAARFHLYNTDNSSFRHHKLRPHAKLLENSGHAPKGTLVGLVAPLEKYYTPTRYPNCHKPQVCPSHIYTVAEATGAIEKANEVHSIAKKLILI